MIQKLLLIALFSGFAICLNAQSADTREGRNALSLMENAPAKQFERHLQQLKSAVVEQDAQQMIFEQSKLLQAVREAMETATPDQLASYTAVLDQFEGFSFHQANAAEQQLRIDALEKALVLMR
ncbi:MAG: hypothetical protein IPL65_18040 [Lewinellaceae bacterium]|nr:hypothetical protein [Lewinellaceae bacterium]